MHIQYFSNWIMEYAQDMYAFGIIPYACGIKYC